MAVKDVIPNSVLWNDVRDTLNAHGGSVVNTDTSSAFDERGNVNYAARYKPTKYSEESRESNLGNWWSANNGNCGVLIDMKTKLSELKGVTDASSFWAHDYPTGGTEEPFHFGDFRNYNPNAKMVSDTYVSSDELFISGGLSSVCAMSFRDNLGTNALDYTEIKMVSGGESTLSSWYFGVIAIGTSGTRYGMVSLPYSMKQLNSITDDVYYTQNDHYAFVNLNGGIFPYTGEYDLYPVLFGNAHNANDYTADVTITNGYIPLPVKPARVTVKSLSSLYSAEITSVSLAGTTLTINYKVSSSEGQFIFNSTNNTPTLTVRAYTDIAEGVEVFPYDGNTFASYVGNYTVPAGGSENCSDQVTILSPSAYRYISVEIRWPIEPNGFAAIKMDIEI